MKVETVDLTAESPASANGTENQNGKGNNVNGGNGMVDLTAATPSPQKAGQDKGRGDGDIMDT